jgi:hypothetical protein
LPYGVSEATVCRTIKKIENVLMKSGEFRLPGKKKPHPQKAQLIVNQKTLEIIATDLCNGSKHAFSL